MMKYLTKGGLIVLLILLTQMDPLDLYLSVGWFVYVLILLKELALPDPQGEPLIDPEHPRWMQIWIYGGNLGVGAWWAYIMGHNPVIWAQLVGAVYILLHMKIATLKYL